MDTYVTSVRFVGTTGTHKQPENPITAIRELVKDEAGNAESVYPVLGADFDLLVVCNFPNLRAATKAWLALDTRFGWQTQTHPMVPLEIFEEIYGQISTPARATR